MEFEIYYSLETRKMINTYSTDKNHNGGKQGEHKPEV